MNDLCKKLLSLFSISSIIICFFVYKSLKIELEYIWIPYEKDISINEDIKISLTKEKFKFYDSIEFEISNNSEHNILIYPPEFNIHKKENELWFQWKNKNISSDTLTAYLPIQLSPNEQMPFSINIIDFIPTSEKHGGNYRLVVPINIILDDKSFNNNVLTSEFIISPS